MNVEKELYTKADITQKLGIKSYILSLWEKEFGIATITAADGQTLYTTQNFAQLKKITELIYEKGYSLEVAKKALIEQTSEIAAPQRSSAVPLLFEPVKKHETKEKTLDPEFTHTLQTVKTQLIKLRQLLSN